MYFEPQNPELKGSDFTQYPTADELANKYKSYKDGFGYQNDYEYHTWLETEFQNEGNDDMSCRKYLKERRHYVRPLNLVKNPDKKVEDQKYSSLEFNDSFVGLSPINKKIMIYQLISNLKPDDQLKIFYKFIDYNAEHVQNTLTAAREAMMDLGLIDFYRELKNGFEIYINLNPGPSSSNSPSVK